MNKINKTLSETISEHLTESSEVYKQNELPPVELKATIPGLIDQKIELANLYREFRLSEQRVSNGTLNEMEPGARYIRDLNVRKIAIIREKFDSKFKDLLGVEDISELNDLDEAFAVLEEAGAANSENLTHWAVFLPKEGSEHRDHIALPVDGTKKDELHASKFKKVFGKDIAAAYRLDRVEPKKTNEDFDRIDDDTFAVLEGQTPAERLRWAGARRIARKLIPGAGKLQARKQEKHEREQAYYAGQEYVRDGGKRRDTKPGDDYWDTNTMANRHHRDANRWGKIARGESPFKEDFEQIDEISLKTAISAGRQMRDTANDYYASKEDEKRTNRFRNKVQKKFGEKGSKIYDKALGTGAHKTNQLRQMSRANADKLASRDMTSTNPANVLRGGPRKGQLKPDAMYMLKYRLRKEEAEQIDEMRVKVGPEQYHKGTDTVWHVVHHNGKEIGTVGTNAKEHHEKHGKWGFEDSRGWGRRNSQPKLNSKEQAVQALTDRHKEYVAKETNEEVEQIGEAFVIHKGKHAAGETSSLAGQTHYGVEIKDVYADKNEAQAHADKLNQGRGYKPEDQKNPAVASALYQVSPKNTKKVPGVPLNAMFKINEKAPPGMEDWVKGRKEDFKERYGDRWEEVLYRTAWKMYNKKEEAEQIDELNDRTLQSYKSKSQNSVEKMTKALRGREYGKVDPNKLKQRAAGIKLATAKLKKEEAEGKVAITPKEKTLAAHHGDPKRITYGDVIKARIKSGKSK